MTEQELAKKKNLSKKRLALGIASPLVVAATLAVVFDATAASAATPTQFTQPQIVRTAAVTLSQGFDVRNLSSHTVTLNGIDSPGGGDGTPDIGTVLRPGESLHYEKIWHVGNQRATTLRFSSANPAGTTLYAIDIDLSIDPFLNIPSIRMPWGGPDVLEVQGLGRGLNSATIVDKAGSGPVVVSDADKQRQADLLNRLCVDGKAACTFAPTKSEAGPVQTERKTSERNTGTKEYTYSKTETFTFTSTANLELSATAKSTLLGLVEVGMGAKYNKGWTEGRTETVTRTMVIPPKHVAVIDASTQTIRQTGTFKVTMGNTRWELTDVYFDIPDQSKPVEVEVATQPY